jgi:hypothetical protein
MPYVVIFMTMCVYFLDLPVILDGRFTCTVLKCKLKKCDVREWTGL